MYLFLYFSAMKQMEINGALLIDVLKGVSIECHGYSGEYWGVIGRTRNPDAEKPFIEYQTDEWGDFQIVGWHEGDIRKVTKQFLSRLHGIAIPEVRKRGRPVGSTKDKIKPNNRKHMSRGEWLEIQNK